MSKTVVGLFDDFARAQSAVKELETAGIPHNDISLVASNSSGAHDRYSNSTPANAAEGASTGAGSGATTGAVVGGGLGLLAGLGLMAIPGFGPIVAAGWLVSTLTGAGIGAAAGGLLGALVGAGVPHEEAQLYNEGVRRGGTLVAVKTADEMADRAAAILTRHGAVDIDERADTYRRPMTSPTIPIPAPVVSAPVNPMPAPVASAPVMPPPAMPPPMRNMAETTGAAPRGEINENERAIPVIEEELQVGKREVQRGGVRVYSHVTEQPVTEQISLHEEHVNVERRPVDRPITGFDNTAFKEESFELRETAEEAVISKQARVVEEVVLGKTATDRTETVRDTVRRTDVEVEQIDGQHSPRNSDFANYESDFRSNFGRTYANSGMSYEQYSPAYEYGHGLYSDPRYRGRDWNSIQSDVQRDWESRRPGTWDRFSNAIRYAWDKSTGAERGGIKTGGINADGSPDTRGVTEKIADTVTGDRIDDKTGRPVI